MVSSLAEAPLSWFLDTQVEPPVLVIGGLLDETSGGFLFEAVVAQLRQDQAHLLLDVAAVSVSGAEAVAVFARIMDEALRWPDVLVLVCAASAVMAPLLSADVLDPRLLLASVADGRSAALASVPAVAEDLAPTVGAPSRAREVVADACRRWEVPELAGLATLVASELITNATVHARTTMRIQIRLLRCHLHIAVFDGSAVHAVQRRHDRQSLGGRGIDLVAGVSAAWGSFELPTGKVVWSALDRQPRVH